MLSAPSISQHFICILLFLYLLVFWYFDHKRFHRRDFNNCWASSSSLFVSRRKVPESDVWRTGDQRADRVSRHSGGGAFQCCFILQEQVGFCFLVRRSASEGLRWFLHLLFPSQNIYLHVAEHPPPQRHAGAHLQDEQSESSYFHLKAQCRLRDGAL